MWIYDFIYQENGKLKAQTEAQESVIEGLRSERKLWGQELAQQGKWTGSCIYFSVSSLLN